MSVCLSVCLSYKCTIEPLVETNILIASFISHWYLNGLKPAEKLVKMCDGVGTLVRIKNNAADNVLYFLLNTDTEINGTT